MSAKWRRASSSSFCFWASFSAVSARSLVRTPLTSSVVPLCILSMNSRYDCTIAWTTLTATCGSLEQ